MIGAIAARFAIAWLLAAALQLVLWAVARRTRNAGIVDVGWAGAFGLVAIAFAIAAPAPARGWWPILVVVLAWSGRLTTYLIVRGAASGPEEGRYAELRRRWAPNVDRAFLIFFQAQAAMVGVLALAFAVPFVAEPAVPALCWLGALIALGGVAGETLADRQLARFRADPTRKGQVCDVGLWSWSRHPNYFFEWCVWIGHAVYSLAFVRDGGWIALFPQLVILGSILKVTGIPATEAQAIRSRGDKYRAYQRRVGAFVPLPPRRT